MGTEIQKNSCLNPNTRILDIDPRSPTIAFVRTPIVVESPDPKLPSKIHNKNLDNARKQLIQQTPIAPKTRQKNVKEEDLQIKVTPPKLLESSPITLKTETKRHSLVGMLETNIDYTETDLDKVLEYKIAGSVAGNNEDGPEVTNSSIVICETENVDPRSPTMDFIRTPLQILKKVGEIDLNDSQDEDEPVKTYSELKKVDLIKDVDTHVITEQAEENIKEFDTKLTNLIYEDADTILSIPRTTKPKEGSRTPLGIRNMNRELSKSASKLRVSDKPTKQALGGSKIPIFKDKTHKIIQCENTPPRSMITANAKQQRSQWDNDNTLII